MLRHILTGALMAVTLAAPAAAQTRATYVLSNGEKHNGVIVYGRGDNNIVDDKFHVNKSGQELVFEQADVAVIDFAGSAPSAVERDALGDTGMMVMRDGSTVRGHLHNILKPDLVQWVNEGGQRNNYPISDVRRLYLNPEVAKRVFLNAASAPVVAGGTSSRSSVASRAVTRVRVDGNAPWVDSGLDVRRGDRIMFNAAGTVEYGPNTSVNPAGVGARDRRVQTNANYPVPEAAGGSLIGRIGDSQPFAIGNSREVTAQEDGRLMLGVNDDIVSDNKGTFTVEVRR